MTKLPALVLLAVSLAGCAGPAAASSSADPPRGASQTPLKPVGPATSITDGTYQVGRDVLAGRYRTPGPPADSAYPSCYWARNKNDSGEGSAIIANGITAGPGSVTVKTGEFFQVTGDCTWTKS